MEDEDAGSCNGRKHRKNVMGSSSEDGESAESDQQGSDCSDDDADGNASEADEGESGDESSDSDGAASGGDVSSSSADEGSSTAEVCPICLSKFRGQEVGNPESCDHHFCLDHILEWAKNVSTCPVDRQPFSLVLVRRQPGGNIIRQVSVEQRHQLETAEPDDPTYCEVCNQCDGEERLLLCDGCDAGYHLECLQPPLLTVPVDEWFCPECAPLRANPRLLAEEVGVSQEEVLALLDDPEYTAELPQLRAGPRRHRAQRLLPRTRLSQRISARIQGGRPAAAAAGAAQRAVMSGPSTSSGRSHGARSTATSRTKRKTTKRKTTKRKGRAKKGGAKKRRRKKTGLRKTKTTSKSKKRRPTCRRVPDEEDPYERTRQNLRRLLAIRRMKPGQMAPPAMRSGQPHWSARLSVGAGGGALARLPTLSLFGRRDELPDIVADSSADEADTLLGSERAVAVSSRPISRREAVARLKRAAAAGPSRRPPAASAPAPAGGDVLHGILASQTVLHARRGDVAIQRDGRLTLRAGAGGSGGGEAAVPLRSAAFAVTGTGAQGTVSRTGGGDSSSPRGQGNSGGDTDPRGTNAYASYLRSNSDGGRSPAGISSAAAAPPAFNSQHRHDDTAAKRNEEPDLYSDIEPPRSHTGADSESESEEGAAAAGDTPASPDGARRPPAAQLGGSDASSVDSLVIDDQSPRAAAGAGAAPRPSPARRPGAAGAVQSAAPRRHLAALAVPCEPTGRRRPAAPPVHVPLMPTRAPQLSASARLPRPLLGMGRLTQGTIRPILGSIRLAETGGVKTLIAKSVNTATNANETDDACGKSADGSAKKSVDRFGEPPSSKVEQDIADIFGSPNRSTPNNPDSPALSRRRSTSGDRESPAVAGESDGPHHSSVERRPARFLRPASSSPSPPPSGASAGWRRVGGTPDESATGGWRVVDSTDEPLQRPRDRAQRSSDSDSDARASSKKRRRAGRDYRSRSKTPAKDSRESETNAPDSRRDYSEKITGASTDPNNMAGARNVRDETAHGRRLSRDQSPNWRRKDKAAKQDNAGAEPLRSASDRREPRRRRDSGRRSGSRSDRSRSHSRPRRRRSASRSPSRSRRLRMRRASVRRSRSASRSRSREHLRRRRVSSPRRRASVRRHSRSRTRSPLPDRHRNRRRASPSPERNHKRDHTPERRRKAKASPERRPKRSPSPERKKDKKKKSPVSRKDRGRNVSSSPPPKKKDKKRKDSLSPPPKEKKRKVSVSPAPSKDKKRKSTASSPPKKSKAKKKNITTSPKRNKGSRASVSPSPNRGIAKRKSASPVQKKNKKRMEGKSPQRKKEKKNRDSASPVARKSKKQDPSLSPQLTKARKSSGSSPVRKKDKKKKGSQSPPPKKDKKRKKSRSSTPVLKKKGKAKAQDTSVSKEKEISENSRSPSPDLNITLPEIPLPSPVTEAQQIRASSQGPESPTREGSMPRAYANGSLGRSWAPEAAAAASPVRRGSRRRDSPPPLSGRQLMSAERRHDEAGRGRPQHGARSSNERSPAASPRARSPWRRVRRPRHRSASSGSSSSWSRSDWKRTPTPPPSPIGSDVVELSPPRNEAIVITDSDGDEPPRQSPKPERRGPHTPPPPAPAPVAPSPVPAAPTARRPSTPPPPPAPRGPATPPEPAPDRYDPFEPTHSGPGSPATPPAGDSSVAAGERRAGALTAQMEGLFAATEHSPVNGAHATEAPMQPQLALDLLTGLATLASVVSKTKASAPSATAALPAAGAPSVESVVAPAADMELASPTSPLSSDSPGSPDSHDADDLFEPPAAAAAACPAAAAAAAATPPAPASGPQDRRFDDLFGAEPTRVAGTGGGGGRGKTARKEKDHHHRMHVRKANKHARAAALTNDGLELVDDVPNSAVEMLVKQKYLKKLNRQERVVEAVKLILKPYFHQRAITKEQYKEILGKCVSKVCHSKTEEIVPEKIQSLVLGYVEKYKHHNKKATRLGII